MGGKCVPADSWYMVHPLPLSRHIWNVQSNGKARQMTPSSHFSSLNCYSMHTCWHLQFCFVLYLNNHISPTESKRHGNRESGILWSIRFRRHSLLYFKCQDHWCGYIKNLFYVYLKKKMNPHTQFVQYRMNKSIHKGEKKRTKHKQIRELSS